MVKLVFLDVDGCLSDGGIFNANDGEELKRFDVKDGFLLQQWNKMGFLSAIITGKSSQIVASRAELLGVKHCFQGVGNKLEKAEQILQQEGLSWKECACIGDDLNDIKLLKQVGFSFAPSDATSEVLDVVKHRLTRRGGHGAVREMLEEILRQNGVWEEFLQRWL